MATYNGAKFIREQLDSLAKQTLLPVELVICDDRSTDQTAEVIREFAATAPFPVHLHINEKNLGWRDNFMKAAGLCKGDLISFCDQDDVWLPTKLEKCAKPFEDRHVLLAYHNATITDQHLKPEGSLAPLIQAREGLNPPQSLDPMLIANGFCLVFRRELLNFTRLREGSSDFWCPTEKASHDQWFFFIASALGSIYYISEPLAYFRRHGNTTTGSYQNILRSRIHNFFFSDVEFIRRRQVTVQHRIFVLRDAQDVLGYSYRHLAWSAADGYRHLERSCRRRLSLYGSRNPFFRLIVFMMLLLGGGYARKENWGSGKIAMVRDILRGFLVPLYAPSMPRQPKPPETQEEYDARQW